MDLIELPNEHYKDAIEEIIKENNIKDYKIDISMASGKGENYFGVLYRIKVSGVDESGNSVSLVLVMKIPPQSDIIRANIPVGKIYTREGFIYDVFLPQLNELQDDYNISENDRFPLIKSYKTCSENLKEYIVMEDACASGFKMSERRKPLNYEQVKIILTNMGRLHAMSFVLKRIHPEKFETLTKNTFDVNEMFNENFAQMMEVCVNKATDSIEDEELKAKMKQYSGGIFEKFSHYIDSDVAQPYAVICHGDCWNNNLMFKIKDCEAIECRFVDWQMVKYSSGITDIAYFMFTSTDYDLRKNHFSELMDAYYGSLSNTLTRMEQSADDCYPRSVFDKHLKMFLPYGLCIAIMLLPAVLGETEDALNVEDIVSEGAIDNLNKKKFGSTATQDRFAQRLEGVVRSFVDLDLF